MSKIGIIRCQQTEDLCPGIVCLTFAGQAKDGFEAVGQSQVIGFESCGGCPGKRAVARAKMMKAKGADAIFLSSCITKGSPIGFPCPNREKMLEAIRKAIPDTPVYEYTHN